MSIQLIPINSVALAQIYLRSPWAISLLHPKGHAPPKGTLDPEILLWCEENRCILVTNNRKSMPVHLADHIALGHHVPGIFILNPKLSIGENLDQLILIAEGSFDDEYQDRIEFIPLF